MRSLFFLSVALILNSNIAMASELAIHCTDDYHVLAMYEHSGEAIERSSADFTIAYKSGSYGRDQRTIQGKIFIVEAACLMDGQNSSGQLIGYPAIMPKIVDGTTGAVLESFYPLSAQSALLDIYLPNQPPILQGEVSRTPFWSIDCHWQGDLPNYCNDGQSHFFRKQASQLK